MLSDNICSIEFKECVKDWKEAIRVVAKPLEDKGYIKRSYVKAMIENVIKNGAYIVIMPGFAMPHARPECGAIKNGMSILKLKESVVFPDNQEVNFIVSFSATDEDEHMNLMAEFSEILIDDIKVEKFFNSTSTKEIMEVVQ